VTDLPADFEVFGQAVATSMADLLGGTSGQILAKNSNTDMDFVWVANDVGDITAVTAGTGISGGGTSGAVTITNSMATEIAAKGDLIVGTGSATFDNLSVGANDLLVTAASGEATGLKYTGGWTTWTPTYANITIGNGTVIARYQKIGKLVTIFFRFILGSTSAIGTSPSISLPIASSQSEIIYPCKYLDSGVTNYFGIATMGGGTTTMLFQEMRVNGTYGDIIGNITATVPFTWTTNDSITLQASYEVA
jgi:hypothetical protein